METLLIKLTAFLEPFSHQDLGIAFSGGVDSSLLLKIACDLAKKHGTNVHAITFETKLHPKADLENAKKLAEEFGAIHQVFYIDELEQEALLNNPIDRCYICKKELFSKALAYGAEQNITQFIDGTNGDDLKEYRPGLKALKELGVISPLASLAITKAEVRGLAALLAISVAQRPSAPCLATRLPYGARISYPLLEQIEAGENYLKGLGFEIVRIRLHEDIVRIEIPQNRFDDILPLFPQIIAYLKELGFVYVTLDLEGFRSGSMDVYVKTETQRIN